jgi:CheY-like chemotaxis protein
MKFLVVEDDDFKITQVLMCLATRLPEATVAAVGSVQAAVLEIAGGPFDFIILDMALPSHTVKVGESAPQSMLSGGLEVIMELSYLNRSDPVIILTQYPEIEIEGTLLELRAAGVRLRELYSTVVQQVIHYQHGSDGWMRSLDIALQGDTR